MSSGLNGELVPVGGGDSIPLIRPVLTVGRRESCDICMHFPNISGVHCELSFRDGCWFIRDLNSTNGIQVNNARVQEKVLRPKDEVTIGKRKYTIEYTMSADAKPPADDVENVMGQSLLEKAGLQRAQPVARRPGPASRTPIDAAEALRIRLEEDD